MMHDRRFFVSGLYRTGSTLLDKLLHNHPDMVVGSQPFPLLYVHAKNRFLRERGLQRSLPIDTLFLEYDYTLDEFYTFLDHYTFDADSIQEILHSMTNYSGQYMPDFLALCLKSRFSGGTFFDVYARFIELLQDYFDAASVTRIGTRETFSEEYIPYFLRKDIRVIAIVRDPRDVVTSMIYGSAKQHAGDARPLLFMLRQWRKSVSFYLEFEGHPDFIFLRYEDLVLNTESVLQNVTRFLELKPFAPDHFEAGILDQKGAMWKGNSSFHEFSSVSNASIGQFRTWLPAETIRYIETVCMPELHVLNYDLVYPDSDFDPNIIESFRDPYEVNHRLFPPDYSYTVQRIQEEIQRLELLRSRTRPDEKQQRLWFIHPRTYTRLRDAVAKLAHE